MSHLQSAGGARWPHGRAAARAVRLATCLRSHTARWRRTRLRGMHTNRSQAWRGAPRSAPRQQPCRCRTAGPRRVRTSPSSASRSRRTRRSGPSRSPPWRGGRRHLPLHPSRRRRWCRHRRSPRRPRPSRRCRAATAPPMRSACRGRRRSTWRTTPRPSARPRSRSPTRRRRSAAHSARCSRRQRHAQRPRRCRARRRHAPRSCRHATSSGSRATCVRRPLHPPRSSRRPSWRIAPRPACSPCLTRTVGGYRRSRSPTRCLPTSTQATRRGP